MGVVFGWVVRRSVVESRRWGGGPGGSDFFSLYEN